MDAIVIELETEPQAVVSDVPAHAGAFSHAPHEARILALEEQVRLLTQRLKLADGLPESNTP